MNEEEAMNAVMEYFEDCIASMDSCHTEHDRNT